MNWFQKWCARYWLCAVYGLGLGMLAAMPAFPDMTMERKLPFLLAVLLPLHVLEENTWPRGFHYMMNLVRKSDRPNAGPMNTLTNMVSNLGAELLLIGLALGGGSPGTTLLVAFFGFGETAAHTVLGVAVRKKLRDRGMRTIYGPGLATACLTLLPLSVRAVAYLRSLTLTGGDLLTGAVLAACFVGGLIRLPIQALGRFQPGYAFPDSGYFERFRRASDRPSP